MLFIIGTGRCGTTLLTRILASHPDLRVYPNEANHLWHPQLYPLDKLEANKLGACPIEIDPVAFTRISVRNWPRNHAESIQSAFYSMFTANHTPRTLVIKSAMISFMIPTIIDLFPQARFVHIYRFGPSVVASYVEKNHASYKSFRYPREEYLLRCAGYWNSCVLETKNVFHTLFGSNSGRFFELSYETLCAVPDEQLQQLASFIGIRPEKFDYDSSSIISTNWKVGDVHGQRAWQKPLQIMQPALKLLSY